MEAPVLYLSVLEKLIQLSPNDLAKLDEFLSKLVKNNIVQTKDKKDIATDSSIYWLEQLAIAKSLQSIDDPVGWQRQVRQDRPLIH